MNTYNNSDTRKTYIIIFFKFLLNDISTSLVHNIYFFLFLSIYSHVHYNIVFEYMCSCVKKIRFCTSLAKPDSCIFLFPEFKHIHNLINHCLNILYNILYWNINHWIVCIWFICIWLSNSWEWIKDWFSHPFCVDCNIFCYWCIKII